MPQQWARAMEITRLPAAEVLASLQSSTGGLDDAEAGRRLREFGSNSIEEVQGQPLWLRLLREFTHFFALILWVAAALAFFAEFVNPDAGMRQLGFAIVAVILINGVFSFFQEFRAEQALDALRRLLPATTKVIRGGELRPLPVETLVPGDLILLEAGDNVPADCRLIEASGLRVNLATLTGESMPVTLTAEGMPAERSLESKNVVLTGTSLVSGSGTAVVFATGMRTEFGRIAHLTQTVGEAGSPLQREIARLSRLVAFLALALGVVFFGVAVTVGLPIWHSAMFAVGIIVANVPEGLLPTVTLSLAMGTQRMAKRNALVRHLPSVETLGATSVICSDKTGTLTQNIMSVRQAFVERMESPTAELAQFDGEEHLLRSLRHCHNLKRSRNGGEESWLGDPMEVALRVFGERGVKVGVERVVEEIPFDSDLRRMSVVVEHAGRRWVYCKGAPEAVLDLCTRVQSAAGEIDLDAVRRQHVLAAQASMTTQGLRVLGFAYRELPNGGDSAQAGMTFSGLVGLRDPPRLEVREALERCHSAGIKVVMVTGDHPQTAVAIGREIGLVRVDEPLVIHGDRLRRMSDAQLRIALDAPEILFTRVTADQKLRVVEALKAKGHIVAVTGDGVNDAPALKAAHIGVAMGLSGTDVAKEAADMVLLDDNFASIVNAIEEGRAVYQNIRKFLTYILTSNVPEIVPYLAFVLFRIPLPLTVIQILAVDLGTDMLPAVALGAERPHRSLMDQPPRPREERLLSWPVLARAYLWLGLLQAAAALAAFFIVLRAGGWQYGEVLQAPDPLYLQATTACLAAIVAAQVVNVFACRHPERSMFSLRLLSNPLLLVGVAAEIVLLLAIVYTSLGNAAFGTAPLAAATWQPLIGFAIVFGLLEELRKAVLRRRRKSAG